MIDEGSLGIYNTLMNDYDDTWSLVEYRVRRILIIKAHTLKIRPKVIFLQLTKILPILGESEKYTNKTQNLPVAHSWATCWRFLKESSIPPSLSEDLAF